MDTRAVGAAEDLIGALASVAREAAEGTYGSAIAQLQRVPDGGTFLPLVQALGLLLGRVEAREMRLENLVTGTIRALVAAEDAKSQWTAGHSFRVAGLAVQVGEKFRLPRRKIRELHYAALLHDIGKIGVPERILENTSPTLVAEDMDKVKHHPVAGQEIVAKIGNDFKAISLAIRHHHERWDGKGYPDGLAGESIPFLSRIIAACDSYDAMRMDRPYQKGLAEPKIRTILEEGCAKAWDPAVVAVLLGTVRRLAE
ncbi:MAG: HD domain-containing protein [Planctomycetes bacterium]|nr:HD domain-containing protein [Planctomycetota bacterium]